MAADRLAILTRRLDRVTRSIALIGFGGLVIVALLTFYDGAARYLGWPRLTGFSDIGEIVFPLVIAASFPAGLLRRSNLALRVAGTLAGERTHSWLEAFAALVTLAFFTLIAWQFAAMTLELWQAARTTPTIELPIAPGWTLATFIMLLCVPVQTLVTAASIVTAVSGRGSDNDPPGMSQHA